MKRKIDKNHFPADVCGLLEHGATRVETVYDRKPVGMESDCITFNKKILNYEYD